MGNLLRAGTKWILLAGAGIRCYSARSVERTAGDDREAACTSDNRQRHRSGKLVCESQAVSLRRSDLSRRVEDGSKFAQLHYLEGLALVGAGHASEAIPALRESVRSIQR